jgi:hypothetical protein
MTCTYTLPAHWAPALANGDFTGLEDSDLKELQNVMASLGVSLCCACECNGEPEFRKYHDAQPYGVLACDCLEYVFPEG